MSDIATSILTGIAEPQGWHMVSNAYDGVHRWGFEKDGKVATVTVSEREIAENDKLGQMTDLLIARLNIGMLTASNSK